MSVKVTVNLPEETVEQLKVVAKERGISMTQVLREAIATQAYVDEQIKDGGKILVEKSDRKTIRELVFR
jgi:predicted DNA-binding protein